MIKPCLNVGVRRKGLKSIPFLSIKRTIIVSIHEKIAEDVEIYIIAIVVIVLKDH